MLAAVEAQLITVEHPEQEVLEAVVMLEALLLVPVIQFKASLVNLEQVVVVVDFSSITVPLVPLKEETAALAL